MNQLFLIATGGALGAMSRFLAVSSLTVLLGKDFPYGTLFVNAFGCFFAGIILVLIHEKGILNPHYQALIIVGFLGAFTTFSAFSIETIDLVQNGNIFSALTNTLLNVAVSISAAYLGMLLTRQI